ncbi:gipl galf transferase, putative [Leishmania tarentolae]|uniref:Gipl galf transferase, putative n=1 Tax=Leishmania tarentolae TaxID=5689 RepID=A0A640KQS5_LEITA|nr:gipl galf transferase, putative [Leishmania tarentolae]
MTESNTIHGPRGAPLALTRHALLFLVIIVIFCSVLYTTPLRYPSASAAAWISQPNTSKPTSEFGTEQTGESTRTTTTKSPRTSGIPGSSSEADIISATSSGATWTAGAAPSNATTAETSSISPTQTGAFTPPSNGGSAHPFSPSFFEDGSELATPTPGKTAEPTRGNKEIARWLKYKLPKDWMECIRRNLQLDRHGEPLRLVTDMTDAIPLLITPLTGDVKFFPYFVCSIDVPVRYHFIIQNERDTDTIAVIDELQRRFGNSGRLLVVRNRYNRGYSGSMNQAFEWALKERTAEEVPWVFACGVDEIFEAGLLSELVKVVQDNTRDDAAMLEELHKEVELEERLVREGNYSYYERWAPPGRPLKVLRSGYPGVPLNVRTAPLMPDRIRYMVADENRPSGIVEPDELRTRFFGNYVATVTPLPYALGTIAVTRLALSTVGYFDENFFPAYMDDIDLRWRHFAYGFRTLYAENRGPEIRWHHYNAANLRGSPFVNSDLEKYGTEDNYSKYAFNAYISRSLGKYDKLKYGVRDRIGVWREGVEKGMYQYMRFNVSHYPADTWVADESAYQCMFELKYDYRTQNWRRPYDCSYNPRTLEESGILGVDQLASYQLVAQMFYDT